MYTLAKRYVKESEDGHPMPGSLEQDLTATPDNFFEKFYTKTEENSLYITAGATVNRWSRLTSAEVAYRPESEQVDPAVGIKFKGVRSVYSQDRSTNAGGRGINNAKDKKISKKLDASDPTLAKRYEELMMKMKPFPDNPQSLAPCTAPDFRQTKEDKFFEAHKKVQQVWDRQLRSSCKHLSRPIGSSVVARAEEYRGKVEKIAALEAATPFDVKYGVRMWSMGLRTNLLSKEAKRYDVHVGSSYNGLWMQVMDNPNRHAEIIRNPLRLTGEFKTPGGNSLLQEKIKKEPKKFNDIMHIKEDALGDLYVIHL